jgi:hypothetical protein
LIIKVRVAQKAANERGHVILSHTRQNQTVTSMPVDRQEEARITREERGITLPPRENDDLLVLQALMPDVHLPTFALFDVFLRHADVYPI